MFSKMLVSGIAIAVVGACTSVVMAQTTLHLTWGPDSVSTFGYTIAPASDVNQDGIPDFLVTDSAAATIGLSLRSGVDGSLLGGVPNGGPVDWSVKDGGHDVDGDGVPDFLAGGSDQNGWVFSGATQQAIRQHAGKEPGDVFSFQGRFLGDLDLDGVPDYAFGAPYTQFAFNKLDYVRVYSGATGQLLREHTSPSFGWDFGCDVEPLGDITGDGAPEYMISTPNADAGADPLSNEGLVQVFDAASGGVLLNHWGAVGDAMGCYIGEVGDWDGDSLIDIAVVRGPPHEIRILSIATGAVIFESEPPTAGTFYRMLRVSNDLDGDGKKDVLVSQWESSLTATPGVVAMGKGLQKVYQFDRPPLEDNGTIFYPTDIAALGDVDGDGRGDWAISNLVTNPWVVAVATSACCRASPSATTSSPSKPPPTIASTLS